MSAPNPSEMSRDELEQRVTELEETVEQLEPLAQLLSTMGDTDPADADLTDVLLAGEPVGLKLQKRNEETSAISEYLFGDDFGAAEMEHHVDAVGTLEENIDTAGQQGPSQAVRDQMLPLHELAADIRGGREERISGASTKRAAELFRRMVRKAAGDPQPGIDNSGGTITIQSSAAEDMILAFDDDLETASSMQVKRAFKQMQSLTKTEDCDCDSIGGCPHGLVQFHPGSTNTVVANTQRFLEYLDDVAAAIEDYTGNTARSTGGGAPEDADDEDHASEAPADDPFAELDAADPVRSDGTANDVVSRADGGDVRSRHAHDGGDTTR